MARLFVASLPHERGIGLYPSPMCRAKRTTHGVQKTQNGGRAANASCFQRNQRGRAMNVTVSERTIALGQCEWKTAPTVVSGISIRQADNGEIASRMVAPLLPSSQSPHDLPFVSRHRCEQNLTLSQFFSHFFRHENGLPQTWQIFVGRFDFSRCFAIRYSRIFYR